VEINMGVFTHVKATAAVVLAVCIGVSLPLSAQTKAPLISYNSQHHPVFARNGMVVSQDDLASQAGVSILKAGGNAVDAAVATGFALAVTHPQAGNLGGGGFMLVYLAEEKKTVVIDYREVAPQLAHRDLFIGEDGNVDNAVARFSYKSSGTPGTVKGLLEAHAKYGSLPLSDVMAPAIQLAGNGFTMTWALADSLRYYKKRLSRDPASLGYFFKPDGSTYEAGELFVQADLAATLGMIAEKGIDGFYKGAVADKIVATMKAGGGIVTHADLENYEVKYREPITGSFRDVEVVTMPPPSSGGIHVVQMLNTLEGWDLKAMGHNSAAYMHRVVESMKYAFADRSKHLGDPDYFDVPADVLTSKSYAAAIRAKIDVNKATPSTEIMPAEELIKESPDTTHFSIMDKAGNMVANTYTLNFSYGSGLSVAGAGFLLNNEMDDFSAKPGSPNGYGLIGGVGNAIEAGKRPLSSMSPTFVFKDGKPYLITGAAGGPRIITSVLHVILNSVEFDMNVQEAAARPRFHHQWLPDRILTEAGFSMDTRRLLNTMGHTIALTPRSGDRTLGSAQSLMVGPNGYMMGAADPRRPGAGVAGY
jgi:gamma-glutamyltranspeptidase/glutathione hydrolase